MRKIIQLIGRCPDTNQLRFVVTKFEPLTGNYRIACCVMCLEEFSKHDVIEIKKLEVKE